MAIRRLSRAELAAGGFGPRSERFVNTDTGEGLSRRQAQNATLRVLGWRNRSEYERVMSDNRAKVITYEALRAARRSNGGRGVRPGRVIGPQTTLARDLRAASRGGWKRTQKGPWARALVAAGMRSPTDRWRVGFSPNSPRRRQRNKRM